MPLNKPRHATLPIPEEEAIKFIQGAAKGGRQKEFDHFFRFRDSFGHFLVTFSDASVAFFVTFLPNSFCRTPFAAGRFIVRLVNALAPVQGIARAEEPMATSSTFESFG